METFQKIDAMIHEVETEISSYNTKRSKLTFFPVEEIDINELNDHHIHYYFKSSYKPLVIRNGCRHFDAVQKWQLDFKYLMSQSGDNTVYVRTQTDCAEYRNGQRYKIDQMKFSKYLQQILDQDAKSQSSYMAVTNIRYKLNELINDVPLCNFELSQKHKNDHVRVFQLFSPKNEYKMKLHSGPHLWIAHREHYEFCHFDPDDSVLCMIAGKKKVRIFAPEFVNAMHCNKRGTKGRTIQSKVDFSGCFDDEYDDYHPHNVHTNNAEYQRQRAEIFTKFEAFSRSEVYGYSTTLNAGDVLFIPAFWFHQVTSLTDSISINYFCGDYDDEYNHFPTRIFGTCYESLKYWFLNIIEQNKNYEQFLSVLGNLEKSIYNTFYKQWHDFLTDEQVDKLTKEVIEYLMDEEVRHEKDIYYKYGDLRIKDNLPKIPRNNPYIKIRGLLYRDD